MTAHDAQPDAAFRLNFDQQQRRAKDLLKAARTAEPTALRRMQIAGFTDAPGFKLAQAQHCVARELRFANWAALKRHITRMDFARERLGAVLDDDRVTMHIRCGHDIEHNLREAGFHGTFNAHINPYLEGPVTDTPDWLERRARFIADGVGPYAGLDYAAALAGAREEERLLFAARDYQRVMLWFEHDRYDQFVLLRCLAFFAEHGAPARLEQICINDFPGATRFMGLGQLPPEALQLLWSQRTRVTHEQLQFGRATWAGFRAGDPRPLVELARNGTLPLPDLAAALLRHLRELPSVENGLGLTQQLILQALAEQGPVRVGRLVGRVMHHYDPLPGLGDISHDAALRVMESLAAPLVLRSGGNPRAQWHLDEVEITPLGCAVLAGQRSWMDQAVPERWVGGVCVRPGQQNWHWSEATRSVMLR